LVVPGSRWLRRAGSQSRRSEFMALRTAFTDLLSLQHPIALAPPSALPSSTNGGAGKGEVAADPAARQASRRAAAHRGLPPGSVGAREAIDLSTETSPAADLVGTLAAQAEEALARAAGRLPVGSGRLAVGARVNLELGGFDREPYLAAGAERQLCDGRGCD